MRRPENYDKAIDLLQAADTKAMAAAYAEALGDIYYQQGKSGQAYKFYQDALAATAADDRTRPILELKINQVLPRQDVQLETESSEGMTDETSFWGYYVCSSLFCPVVAGWISVPMERRRSNRRNW